MSPITLKLIQLTINLILTLIKVFGIAVAAFYHYVVPFSTIFLRQQLTRSTP